jgi:hypothetical protein
MFNVTTLRLGELTIPGIPRAEEQSASVTEDMPTITTTGKQAINSRRMGAATMSVSKR